MTPVRLTKLAEADVAKAAAFYENQKEGLGAAFVDRVMEVVENIAGNPVGYRKRIKDVRMANVSKFPPGLWFRVVDEAVVIGCLDERRNRYWQENVLSASLRCRKGLIPVNPQLSDTILRVEETRKLQGRTSYKKLGLNKAASTFSIR